MEIVSDHIPVEVVEAPIAGVTHILSGIWAAPAFTTEDLGVELEISLSSIEDFLLMDESIFAESGKQAVSRNYIKQCRLTYSTLIRCSELNFRFRRAIASESEGIEIKTETLDELAAVLREIIIPCESLLRAKSIPAAEWKAWRQILCEKLHAAPAARRLSELSTRVCVGSLPDRLLHVVTSDKLPFGDRADLKLILVRFSRILRALGSIQRMLAEDAPLKPALPIFAQIYLRTRELVAHLNTLLTRFPNEQAELFGLFDSASYTANLELKKVFGQELDGILAVRPAPSVYARVETACALLTESFQQILTGFARMADPTVSPVELFSNLQIKLDRSLVLREHLWKITQKVRKAEQALEKAHVDDLKAELQKFLADTLAYVFYKDKETIERFCEEVMAAVDKKDLLPILHRFGTYLETLFGQVNMRSVLASHAFTVKK